VLCSERVCVELFNTKTRMRAFFFCVQLVTMSYKIVRLFVFTLFVVSVFAFFKCQMIKFNHGRHISLDI